MSAPYSFRSVRANPESAVSSIHVELTMKSDIAALLPVVDELMALIRKSRCVPGGERDVECALREGLDNAVVHGNRKDSQKQVHISCQCEPGKELSIIIRDEGAGFDPVKVAPHGITNDGKSGIPLMRLLMDEVHFEQDGREIHMRKRAIPKKAG
jgi:anti-sigma regulatory factor (Ser/Thr protein kinase)